MGAYGALFVMAVRPLNCVAQAFGSGLLTLKSAGLALGGVAHKPWRVPEAEAVLAGKPATREIFAQAAELMVKGAKTYDHNAFKVELAKQCVVKTLMQAAQST